MEGKQFIVRKIEEIRSYPNLNQWKNVPYYVSGYNDTLADKSNWSENIYEAKIFDEVPEYLSKKYEDGILSLDSDEVLNIIFTKEKDLEKEILKAETIQKYSQNQLKELSTLKEKVREARANF